MTEYFVSANSRYTKEKDRYLKNGEAITNSDGNKIDETIFKKIIKKETANFIHQNYNNVIVLVGAGASVLCTEDGIDTRFGKTVAMLAGLINAELKRHTSCFTLQELSNRCKYPISVEITEGAESKLNPMFNLEDFLSDLLSFEKYVSESDRKKYSSSKNKIFELIVENTSYEYDNNCLKHSAFINTVSHLVRTPSKLTMVTTNYDTLIEDAADSIEYTVIDGFTFTHRPHFDSDMFEWNLVKDIENIKTREMEYKKNIINLLKLHGSLTWERGEKGILRKEKGDVKNPIMIFPSANKYMQSYQEPYFELFTKFQELLKRPNTLFITTGFSFADNHISQMIIQAILHNKSLATLISDFNITQNNPNWKKLEELLRHNYKIAFLKSTMNTDLTDYIGEYYDD
ncbi:SIR2 family protein [Anaerostipes hadrus]|uniref:SIR2 family protein n=1 Tax=Anaerostipes hadrus TaxID=649756 RepID=UPI00156DC4E3|nr:SIR2 family protein [Anaerostipes hadrus]NSH29376.1 SIR2 family protein [Anaerostipes hadrus]